MFCRQTDDALYAQDAATSLEKISFNAHIRPIFAKHCVACHGGVKQASELSFVYREHAFAEGESGLRAIVPGDLENSYLIERVSDPDVDFRMPPAEHGPALSAHEITLLREWILQGAVWEEPWSFVPPRQPKIPEVTQVGWRDSPVDRFIANRLQQEGLLPSPPAKRAAWLRRVSFDLIGLPPSSEQTLAFEQDDRSDAYERVIDRLLASPHFGEWWASVWLDLARYADTMGYEADPHRNAWPYRDWLIRAFNTDMPFDEFTIKQLAGDLLEDATLDDRLATTFHRNTQTNVEGGTDDEEFRVAAIIDRVNTTWMVWQATTFGCTQCHSHPYDPIAHDEYYKFMAFWNTSRDCDLDEDYPTLAIPTDLGQFSEAEQLDKRMSEIRRELHSQAFSSTGDAQQWKDFALDHAESTGQTELVIQQSETDQRTTLIAQGTLTARSKYILVGPVPSDLRQLTALRIEVMPKDLEAARRTPEMGFVLSRLQVVLHKPGAEEPLELKFRTAFCDEPEPTLDPEDSLRDGEKRWGGNMGWGDYPRISRPRQAVFILERQIEIAAGDRLELRLEQSRIATGDIALIIQKAHFELTGNSHWTDFVNSPKYTKLRQELDELTSRRQEIPSVEVPVMSELADHVQRDTFVFTRGNWLDKSTQVQPGTPAILPSLSQNNAPNRLDLAKWLVSPENPLTARVMVNRVWEQLFGIGIVETTGNFGTSGAKPSHPELLDFLALRFQGELDWSLKRLLRELALSAAYRQSSRVTPELLKRDPRNRLLARGPRRRLRAEMVRDQALVLSGLFSPKMFGPPVMPSQPEGVWRSAYSDQKWETSAGDDRYRRAIYTYWKRTSGYPSMMAFDTPSREVCMARRITTNSPLQALVTLNDPVFIECAQAFAGRMKSEGGAQIEDKIAWGYRQATGRAPQPAALERLQKLYDEAARRFDEDPEQAKELGATPTEYGLTMVANAILNLDEVLIR